MKSTFSCKLTSNFNQEANKNLRKKIVNDFFSVPLIGILNIFCLKGNNFNKMCCVVCVLKLIFRQKGY